MISGRNEAMNRGDALQRGIIIDTDGRTWNVAIVGSEQPDNWTFTSFEDLVAWMEDEWEGLKIARMGRTSIG
jgi:hypothetical protein